MERRVEGVRKGCMRGRTFARGVALLHDERFDGVCSC